MKPLKKKVSITLDEDIIIHVKAIAEQVDRSFSLYVNLVLKEHLENNKNTQIKCLRNRQTFFIFLCF